MFGHVIFWKNFFFFLTENVHNIWLFKVLRYCQELFFFFFVSLKLHSKLKHAFLFTNIVLYSEIDMSFHLNFEFHCDCQFFIYLLIYLLFLCLILVQIEYFSGVFQTWASSQLSDGIMISFITFLFLVS